MQSIRLIPQPQTFHGQSVTLQPLDAARDGESLFEISHGTPAKEAVWQYLPRGPFEDAAAMRQWLRDEMSGRDPLTFVVQQNAQTVGMLAILRIAPEHGCAEIGHVWMSAEVHKTTVNSQAQFLLLSYLFDELGYRRVEWKCDAQNAQSRHAAHRMGFVFEGRFRQHMIVKGRSRDTDWFSMTDKDWPRCKANFQAYLAAPQSVSLSQLNHG